MNLARILSESAGAHPARPALVGETGTVTHAEIDRQARVAAAVLRSRGVEPGDRVALMLPNGPAFVAAALGALRLGAIIVPLNLLLAPPEVEARLRGVEPRVFLESEDDLGRAEPLDEIVERDDADPAVILFTSGTSGKPKGAILTHGSIHAAARNAADALALGPEDVMLGAAPFSHVLGLSTGMASTLMSGAAIAIVRALRARADARADDRDRDDDPARRPDDVHRALPGRALGRERSRRSGSRTSAAQPCRPRSRATSSARSAARSTRATA